MPAIEYYRLDATPNRPPPETCAVTGRTHVPGEP